MAGPAWAQEVSQQRGKLIAVEDQHVVIEQNGQELRFVRSAEQVCLLPEGSEVVVQYRQDEAGMQLIQVALAEQHTDGALGRRLGGLQPEQSPVHAQVHFDVPAPVRTRAITTRPTPP